MVRKRSRNSFNKISISTRRMFIKVVHEKYV